MKATAILTLWSKTLTSILMILQPMTSQSEDIIRSPPTISLPARLLRHTTFIISNHHQHCHCYHTLTQRVDGTFQTLWFICPSPLLVTRTLLKKLRAIYDFQLALPSSTLFFSSYAELVLESVLTFPFFPWEYSWTLYSDCTCLLTCTHTCTSGVYEFILCGWTHFSGRPNFSS